MIDFHTHIIPNIDDGSKSVEMSVEMIKQSMQYGVTDIVSTSHCYPRYEESIKRFLSRRSAGFELLKDKIESLDIQVPKIHLGCEVNLYTDIAEFKNISDLCIEGTDYILVEMPYEPWREWMMDSVYKLTVLGLKPIMAHIDRFLFQKESVLNSLFELDVLYQVNAELFIQKHTLKEADILLRDGHAHILGSDMHNLTSRKPNLDIACPNIIKRYGKECIEYFNSNSESVLKNKGISGSAFIPPERKSFFGKLLRK